MSHRYHWIARWRIHRLFTEGLGPRARRSLTEELARCTECAALYRRYGMVEAALCRTPNGLSPLAVERLGAFVLEAVRGGAERPSSSRLPPAVLKATAAGLALGALLVVLWPAGSRRERVPLSPESAIAPVALLAKGAAGSNAEVGARLFVVSSGDGQVAERPSLSRSDVVTFTYSNLSPRIHALALFGVQADGVIRWYYPGYDGRRSLSIPGDKVDEPLGDGIRLSVNHTAGWLRIAAVFSDMPLDTEAIERSVRALASRPGAVEALVPFPLPGGAVEQSVLVEVR